MCELLACMHLLDVGESGLEMEGKAESTQLSGVPRYQPMPLASYHGIWSEKRTELSPSLEKYLKMVFRITVMCVSTSCDGVW